MDPAAPNPSPVDRPAGARVLRFPLVCLVGAYALLSALVIAAVRYAAVADIQVPSQLPQGIATWQAFVAILGFLLIIALLVRFISVRAFLDVLLSVTLFLGVWVYAWAILPWEIALLSAAALTILQARIRRVVMHDAFVLIGGAGIAIHFAFLFPLKTLVILLGALLVYDLIAARRHGIATRLAGAFIHRGVVPGLIIPTRAKGLLDDLKRVIQSSDARFLGAGDVVLPLTLVALAAAEGIIPALVVAAGLLLGAAWLGNRRSLKPFPGLVPLLLGSGLPFAMIQFLL